jgi:predicted acylesterase/phospholipase RssA
MRARRLGLLFGLAALLAGCAHYHQNAPLAIHLPEGGYRFAPSSPPSSADEFFVCLSFSGGGTRAAALAYGVMQKLEDTKIVRNGQSTTLLDEVDCISSVSGGSFTAAYYGLFGKRELFEHFTERFLSRDIQGELILRALNPVNWIRLASPWFSRIDLAAELYHETVFERRTFAALAQPSRRPFIILNATDMVTGEPFSFTQPQFDLLGSDLSSYPVGRAVAASSAFPFLLTPVTLLNHGPAAGFERPEDYVRALNDRETNRRRYEWARHRLDYLDAARRPYVHLMDGGLSDNVGLRTIIGEYLHTSGFLAPRAQGAIKRLVLIVVNARTASADTLSARARAPGLIPMALATATVSMENYSFDTIELAKALLDERARAQREVAACQSILLRACPSAPPLDPFPTMRLCVVEVAFDALKEPALRDYFLGLPTSFSLPDDVVQRVVAVGKQLLDESPAFQRLRAVLAGGPAVGAGGGDNCS